MIRLLLNGDALPRNLDNVYLQHEDLKCTAFLKESPGDSRGGVDPDVIFH